MARWAEVMSRRSQWDSDDDFEVEVMAVFSVLGVKMRERGKVLRAAGFEYGGPMQQRSRSDSQSPTRLPGKGVGGEVQGGGDLVRGRRRALQ